MVLVSFFLPQISYGQNPGEPPLTFADIRKIGMEISWKVDSARKNGNVLSAILTLQPLESYYQKKGPAAYLAFSTWMLTLQTEVGNYKAALKYADVGQPLRSAEKYQGVLTGYQPVSAKQAILQAARETQLVMINEAHYWPQHRAFTESLLNDLWKEGYRYFASETLYTTDSLLNKRRFPVQQSGFYSSEPFYGELIRTALKLGFTVVAYENNDATDSEDREASAANNIHRIFKQDPRAKMIIHAGYAHIDEEGQEVGSETLAQRLKKLTGINPFTVNQTEMIEHSSFGFENPVYRLFVSKYPNAQATAFKNNAGQYWVDKKGKYDLMVFHPRTVYKYDRPVNWNKNRSPVFLPPSFQQHDGHYLVFAKLIMESNTAVPVDQLEIRPTSKARPLLLPAGEYTVIVQDGSAREVFRFTTAVKAGR